MRLRRKIQHRVDLVLAQQLGHQSSVSDIALDKDMPCIAIQIRERSAVTRISQQIEIDQFADFPVGRLQGETDKIAADKSGAAGDEEVHKRSDVWRVTNLIDR